MSDRMTSIALPGLSGSGIAEWGRKSTDEMIDRYRRYAQSQVDLYAKVLAASDADFLIETYKGVYVRRNIEVLQAPLSPSLHTGMEGGGM